MQPLDSSSGSSQRGGLIGSGTSLDEIIAALAKRNCLDITPSINLALCGEHPIASGGFCDVYRGELNNGTPVAIKVLRIYDRPGRENEKEKILKRAAREMYHWSRLNHHNILPLMGLAIFRGRLSMISGWMGHGDLRSYLETNSEVNRMDLCLGVCAGLRYIHKKGMVHGDLKAANVMVSPGGVAMLADFGNSQLKDLTLKFTNTTQCGRSIRWTAPELLHEENGPEVSKEADVYAYGMTVLETLTGKVPYQEFTENRLIFVIALKKQLPTRPPVITNDGLWNILVSCWTRQPSERPSIKDVKRRLRILAPQLWESNLASNGAATPAPLQSSHSLTMGMPEPTPWSDPSNRRRRDAEDAAMSAHARALEQARKLQAGEDDDSEEEGSVQRLIRRRFGDQSGQSFSDDEDSEEEESTAESSSEEPESTTSSVQSRIHYSHHDSDNQTRSLGADVPTIWIRSPSNSEASYTHSISDGENMPNPEEHRNGYHADKASNLGGGLPGPNDIPEVSNIPIPILSLPYESLDSFPAPYSHIPRSIRHLVRKRFMHCSDENSMRRHLPDIAGMERQRQAPMRSPAGSNPGSSNPSYNSGGKSGLKSGRGSGYNSANSTRRVSFSPSLPPSIMTPGSRSPPEVQNLSNLAAVPLATASLASDINIYSFPSLQFHAEAELDGGGGVPDLRYPWPNPTHRLRSTSAPTMSEEHGAPSSSQVMPAWSVPSANSGGPSELHGAGITRTPAYQAPMAPRISNKPLPEQPGPYFRPQTQHYFQYSNKAEMELEIDGLRNAPGLNRQVPITITGAVFPSLPIVPNQPLSQQPKGMHLRHPQPSSVDRKTSTRVQVEYFNALRDRQGIERQRQWDNRQTGYVDTERSRSPSPRERIRWQ